jgi:hydrogenase expression/formation protein HypE
MEDVVTTAHGSGGSATGELISDIFAKEFHNDMDDAAVLDAGDGTRIAMTTDSFVVTPQIYRGGDIGRLAVCGTVNDLLMRGSRPRYLTAGFILEEGVSFSLLRRAAHSMAETAAEAGVQIVAGDTKVIGGRSGSEPGLFINTAGCGIMAGWKRADGTAAITDIAAKNARSGDVILVSGTLGDHHAVILGSRLGIDVNAESDNAPLSDMVGNLITSGIRIHSMRDVTRGGLGTVLKELAEASGCVFSIRDTAIPVTPAVSDFCRMLGLDPLYMGNEGKMVCIVDGRDADRALSIIRNSRYGQNACVIGEVQNPCETKPAGTVILKTAVGGERSIGVLQGEGLPRIC